MATTSPPPKHPSAERPARETLEPATSELVIVDGEWKRIPRPFVDYVKSFIARNGAWPGGTTYATPAEIDAYLAIETPPGWSKKHFTPYKRLPEEEEFADVPQIVDGRRLYHAMRRDPHSLFWMMWRGDFPMPLVNSKEKLVWRKSDVIELLQLSERTPNISHRDEGADFDHSWDPIFPRDDLSERDYQREAIITRVSQLSDWQLKRVFEVVEAGASAQARHLPDKAPRLWSDRTSKERINGKGFISPPVFLEAVWRPWLDAGVLSEDDIDRYDPELLVAYTQWLNRKPHERIASLKIGLTKLERRAYGITRETPWEEVVRIAEAVIKAEQRKRRPAAKLSPTKL